MPLQPINYGAAANDGTGDSLREAMRKSQANFEYLDQSKADAQATTQAIAQKADAQATTQAIAQKADAQATAQALEGKVTAEAGKSLMTDTERQKLAGVADQATKNASDSELRDRSKHTGTQAIDTVTDLQTALDAKASSLSVASAIAMAQTFAAVPATFQAQVIFVTQPHLRTFVWNGAKYVRAPWDRPGVLFFSHAPAANVTHGIQVRADVTYNKADYPDLAEILGVAGATFVLPEGRARVLRAADNGRGIDAALVNGYLQEDAIRDITGYLGALLGNPEAGGAIRITEVLSNFLDPGSSGTFAYNRREFKASLVVPTASENRVKSLAATLYITK